MRAAEAAVLSSSSYSVPQSTGPWMPTTRPMVTAMSSISSMARRRPDCLPQASLQSQRHSGAVHRSDRRRATRCAALRCHGCAPVPRRADWGMRARRSGHRRRPVHVRAANHQHRRTAQAAMTGRDGAQREDDRSLRRRPVPAHRGVAAFAPRAQQPHRPGRARARRARQVAPAACSRATSSRQRDARGRPPPCGRTAVPVCLRNRIACHATAWDDLMLARQHCPGVNGTRVPVPPLGSRPGEASKGRRTLVDAPRSSARRRAPCNRSFIAQRRGSQLATRSKAWSRAHSRQVIAKGGNVYVAALECVNAQLAEG
jgi:hypothetical protein